MLGYAFSAEFQQANSHPYCTADARGKPLYGLESNQ